MALKYASVKARQARQRPVLEDAPPTLNFLLTVVGQPVLVGYTRGTGASERTAYRRWTIPPFASGSRSFEPIWLPGRCPG